MLSLLATLAVLSSACEPDDTLSTLEGEEPWIEGPAVPHPLEGRTIFTIFDSFGTSGTWQRHLAELSGCIFDPDLNYNETSPISYGGTPTLTTGWSGQRRALNLGNLRDTQTVDCIFVENVNDVHWMESDQAVGGCIDDQPWMLQQEVNLVPDHDLHSWAEANGYWTSHFAELVAEVAEPSCGTMLVLPYTSAHSGYKLIINRLPDHDGTLTIQVGHLSFGITVSAGMTLDELTARILEYNYGGGWTDVLVAANEVVISYYEDTEWKVTVDAGQTGLDITVVPSQAYTSMRLYFAGDDASQFAQRSAWKARISLYAQYRGLMEYLLREFPEARIYQFIPTYYNGQQRISKLFDCQIAVARLYGIPVLDMRTESGITDLNYTDYYSPGDVHPRAEGYKLWAEAVYRLLQ